MIVSNDEADKTAQRLGRGVLTVVPITSNVQRVHPFQVLLPAGAAGLRTDSKAQAKQVRAAAIRTHRQATRRTARTTVRKVTVRIHGTLSRNSPGRSNLALSAAS